MIDFVRTYAKNKYDFETKVLNLKKFNIKTSFEIDTKEIKYPYIAKSEGLFIKIDHYNGYYSMCPSVLLYHLISETKESTFNLKKLSFSQLQISIDSFIELIKGSEFYKISQLTIGFNVSLNKDGKPFIENNLLAHKNRYYTSNLKLGSKKITKVFDYAVYKLSLSSDKKKFDKTLKISLKLKGKELLNSLGIFNLSDLRKKEIYKELVNSLICKVEELIIVDDINDYDRFNNKDRERIKEYLAFNYWNSKNKKTSRQNLSYHKKNFNGLIDKYELNTLKKDLILEIKKAFQHFIDN